MLMNHPKREDVEISQDSQSDQQISSEPPPAVASTSPLSEDTNIPLSQPSLSQTSTSLRESALRYLERKRVRQEHAQEHASAQIQAIKTNGTGSTDAINRVPTFSPDKSDSNVKIPQFASTGNSYPKGTQLPECRGPIYRVPFGYRARRSPEPYSCTVSLSHLQVSGISLLSVSARPSRSVTSSR